MSSEISGNTQQPSLPYDALLLVSFGAPEGPEDVMPFLENVACGKNIARERLLEIAQHYQLFDGQSPLNAQLRALLAALATEFNQHGLALPIYWGNRNWHPMLADTIAQMVDDGIQNALAFITSPFGSYSSCRQYVEDLQRACQEVGPQAPRIRKLRLFYNHPDFIEAVSDRTMSAFNQIEPTHRSAARLVFSAHSIPVAMASRAPYEHQLREACRLVAAELQKKGILPMEKEEPWELAFQSRSGPASQPWLGPDIQDRMRKLHADGVQDVVVVPIGFVAENMEVVYDLDIELQKLCDELEINMVRAAVVGCHPRFVTMIRRLVMEQIEPLTECLAIGRDVPWPDICPESCCRPPLK